MEHRYDIVLDGHMGERFGTLVWSEADGIVSGVFSLFGFDDPVRGRRDGQRLELKHILRTAVSTLDCATVLKLDHDELAGTVVKSVSGARKQQKGCQNEISKQNRLSCTLSYQSLL